MSTNEQKECPQCGSGLKNKVEEKQVKPIGFGRKDKLSPIHRHHECGAVVLFDRVNPKGLVEALCCQAVKPKNP